ncbi:MAG TPA: type II secretion system F family protein [Gaiellaceae bacterium]|nr:type II secretion system F family protein [Gaiellaceae bacterium]
MRRVAFALLAALVLAPAAVAAGEVTAVDTADLPTVHLTVVAPSTSSTPPALTQDGVPVAGLVATNLAAGKSVMVAIDRSQSMEGSALAEATAAARSFVAAKPPGDRISVLAFGSRAVSLTGFSTSTIDADSALRTMSADSVEGTALYDAVVEGSNMLAAERQPARILILLTDGSNFAEGGATLQDAIQSAQDAGVAVYAIGIEGRQFSSTSLKELADQTKGQYYAAASATVLSDVYSSIADDLRRTWQLEYLTNARAGDQFDLTVKFPDGDEITKTVTAPGQASPSPSGPSPVLPDFFYTSDWGLPVLAGVVGLLALLAVAFALASPRGTWLKGRLEPHVASGRRQAAKRERESRKIALFAPLFRATESVFGQFRQWKRLDAILQRADIPLKTAEFAYIIAASGLVIALIHGAVMQTPWFVALGFFEGACVPYVFVAHRARKRLQAFEDQLPDILVTMAASLKAGHSFRQGMQSVVDEAVDPAAHEFKRVLAEARLGRPMDDALSEMAVRIGSKNFEFVMSAVTIQRQVGGSLAGLFDMVADTVRQRQQFRRKIKGLTAMGRMSAYVLVGLPFVVALAIYAINRDYMEPLLSTSTGHKLIFLIIVMMSIGSAILKKIVSFKG